MPEGKGRTGRNKGAVRGQDSTSSLSLENGV